METLKRFFWWAPHIATFNVAVNVNHDAPWGVDIICDMEDIVPGEQYDGIMTITGFIIFGIITIAKKQSEMKPWKNPNA